MTFGVIGQGVKTACEMQLQRELGNIKGRRGGCSDCSDSYLWDTSYDDF